VRYKTPKRKKDYPVPIATADVRDTKLMLQLRGDDLPLISKVEILPSVIWKSERRQSFQRERENFTAMVRIRSLTPAELSRLRISYATREVCALSRLSNIASEALSPGIHRRRQPPPRGYRVRAESIHYTCHLSLSLSLPCII
jgi:hypothetical protein